jgi:DNA repair protein RadC
MNESRSNNGVALFLCLKGEIMRGYKKYPLEILKVSEIAEGVSMTNPKVVYEFMKTEAMADREIFWVLHLNTKNRVVKKEMVAMGSVDSCRIVPSLALRSVVASGVPCIATVHNHPSGDPTPSQEDRALWNVMKDACKLLGIRLLDNLVIGGQGYYSEEENK